VFGGAWVIGDVEVGEDASVWFNAVLRGDINVIRVGNRTNVQDGAVVHVTRELPAIIGDDVTVGHKAMIHGCRIENACLVGMNAAVLDRAVVGPFAVVAAGSVVKEGFVVPEGMLVAGVPARIVRPLTDEERAFLLQSARNYITYARSYRD
jgi:carbonic anhydrase/acetyltransferase-like protein (isoleucine patch superfamily)